MKNLPAMLIAFALIILGLATQTTIFAWGNSAPNLVLAVVLAYGITRGSGWGAAVGFAGGLTQDLMLQEVVGLSALLMTTAGFSAGFFSKTVRAEGLPLCATVAFFSGLGYQLLYGAFLFIFGFMIAEGAYFSSMLWQPALLTVFFFIPLFLLLRRTLSDDPRGAAW